MIDWFKTGRELDPQQCQLVAGIADRLHSADEFVKLMSTLDTSTFCVGNPDAKFEQMVDRHKGSFKEQSGKDVSLYTLTGDYLWH